jgi:N6-L-threonylcarbamoyladenine synthase
VLLWLTVKYNEQNFLLIGYMYILGIESSCDETAIAIVDGRGSVIAHVLNSQVSMHAKFGGVVPELASRDHICHIVPLLDEALKRAQISLQDLTAIAYTAGPGLIGSLLVGATFAKSLAFALNIKAIAINHLEAHLLAAFLDNKDLQFPFITLLVSGGHTRLLEAKTLGQYKVLGDTLDDAVGEAFDKTAKLIGIDYPGGARLAALADKCKEVISDSFPRPLIKRKSLDFSFSGLKTHALQYWQNSSQDESAKMTLAKAFQDAVIDVLVAKCERALAQTGIKTLVVAGGVGANLSLRSKLKESCQNLAATACFPAMEYCTDNGAMVAYAGFLYYQKQCFDDDWAIKVQARWEL